MRQGGVKVENLLQRAFFDLKFVTKEESPEIQVFNERIQNVLFMMFFFLKTMQNLRVINQGTQLRLPEKCIIIVKSGLYLILLSIIMMCNVSINKFNNSNDSLCG